MRALIGIRNGLIISLVFWALLFLVVKCFAQETTVVKVDEFSARITVSSVTDKDDIKTTVSQEKTFTLTELLQAKQVSETTLKFLQSEKARAANTQMEQIALWERLIKQTTDLGIVAKPIAIWEENKNVDKVIEPIVEQATKGD